MDDDIRAATVYATTFRDALTPVKVIDAARTYSLQGPPSGDEGGTPMWVPDDRWTIDPGVPTPWGPAKAHGVLVAGFPSRDYTWLMMSTNERLAELDEVLSQDVLTLRDDPEKSPHWVQGNKVKVPVRVIDPALLVGEWETVVAAPERRRQAAQDRRRVQQDKEIAAGRAQDARDETSLARARRAMVGMRWCAALIGAAAVVALDAHALLPRVAAAAAACGVVMLLTSARIRALERRLPGR
ncbi:hypothetical protein ICW40_05730 [Actinotalea ferrariae]|uniref:hypothetical protein n=1 Tax=Actinotalea ferrariae TaxID=1386098 RepID=UPI001C8C9F88|nr:hypothetical protein [Actinotalea ferrariae]MBX9244306.1 hypothetical protein [Actinotalea ferrariae]